MNITFAKGKLFIDGVESTPEQLQERYAAQQAATDKATAELAAFKSAKSAGAGALKIELLSVDGALINGIITTKADPSSVVYSQKPAASNKLTAPRDVTELDIVQVAGYVLVGRTGDGRIKSVWGQAPDIGRPMPLTAAGVLALQAIFAGGKSTDAA